MFRRIARASVGNPVAVHMATLFLLAAGAFLYFTMPREIFPEFTRERIRVQTLFPGASPEDVEELVTVKIEDAIHGVDGIEQLDSTSQEGLSRVDARLVPGSDVSRVLMDVDRAVQAITDLPDDAEEPLVDEVKTRFPVITLSVHGAVSELALKEVVRPIQRRMEALPGVGEVQLSGLRALEWHVEADPDALLRYHLTLGEVAAALAAHNLNVPGGTIDGPADELLVRTRGETRTAAQVEAVLVRASPAGDHVRVGDVARVTPGFERALSLGRFDGQPSINLTAMKMGEGDILAISAAVKALATELELPAGVEASVHTDLSVFLRDRLEIMTTSALQGFVLVFASLCLFLNWRMALLVAMGIPLAFLATFVGMKLTGISINMMSLFALILILGMLVDDAIIVVENIYRRIEEGEAPARAAVRGTAEVAQPVIATVLTTIAAFGPMLLTPGEMGQWFWQVPVVVSLCLGASLIECLAILPCHVAEVARPLPPPSGTSRFERFLVRYEAFVRRALGARYLLLALVIGLSGVLVVWSASQLQFVLFGKFESETYFLNFELPSSSSLDQTSERARELERIVLALPPEERAATITNLGFAAVDYNRADLGSNLGQVVFNLTPASARRRSADEIVAGLRAEAERLPGFTKIEFKGLQAGPGGAAIEVALEGEDFRDLMAASDEVQAWLRAQPGVQDVFDDVAPGKPELEVQVDLEAAAAVGLTTADVARQVRDAFQGREATTVRRGDEDVPLVVRFPADARARREELESLWLRAPGEARVPLRAVARLVESRGLAKIVRGERRRAVTVLGDVDLARANALEVSDRLQRAFQRPLGARGIDLRFKGQRQEAEQSMAGMVQALGLAVLLIYVILGTQFRSFLQPFFVMIAIPFGIDGILLGHALMGEDLSFLSLMGLIACSGIVVNDSLVLVDHVNGLRRQGVPPFEAAVRGSVRRLRPILLTTITTVFGLVPLAFFATGQAKFLSPMAVAIVFGLSFSTILTLLVIPSLYLVLEDLKALVGRPPGAGDGAGPSPAL